MARTSDLFTTANRGLAWALLAAGLSAPPLAAQAAGNAANGANLFATHCAECHSVREGKEKKGPSLFGVLGRPSAASTSFVYSDALRAANLSWTPENLDAYLAAPGRRVPGGNMKFDGLPVAAERADLIAYLASLTGK